MMGKKLVVLGAGESGIGAAILGKKKGYEVFLSEKKKIDSKLEKMLQKEGIKWESGRHSIENLISADYVVKSPGISSNIPLIKSLKEKGKNIISEIEFAALHTSAILIGITGTNGKTTTTLLTYQILKDAGLNVGIAGNIGNSFSLQVAKMDFDIYVLEISSFQLDDICKFSPHIAVITNITYDHLDRYNFNFENYVKAKLKIIKNQSKKDFFLFNSNDPLLMKALKNINVKAKEIPMSDVPIKEGVFIKNKNFIVKQKNKKTMINFANFTLSGRHNLLNAMAASTVASLLDISKDSIRESLTHFKGAPHRMEKVLSIQRVQYINDSKATNTNATFFALDSIDTPVVWIAGGVDKGNNYESLLPLIRKKIKAIVCLGINNEKLFNTFENVVEILVETQSMSEAVKISHKIALAKETVLLSPACASFDLFKNYEDRGNQFKEAVRNL